MYAQLDFTQNRYKLVNLIGDEELGITQELILKHPSDFIDLERREDIGTLKTGKYYDTETDTFIDYIPPIPEPDPIPEPVQPTETELILMSAQAELFEHQISLEEQNLTIMEAQAEMYELLLSKESEVI